MQNDASFEVLPPPPPGLTVTIHYQTALMESVVYFFIEIRKRQNMIKSKHDEKRFVIFRLGSHFKKRVSNLEGQVLFFCF